MSDIDPYAPMRSLADGWRAQAADLVERADQQEWRAHVDGGLPLRDRSPLASDPEVLRQAARTNKTTAATFMKAASDLDASIDFARRHVLGATS